MTVPSMSSLPRADVRAQLLAQDDPKARERTRVYPTPHGPPAVHDFQLASAADLMDRFSGSTYGEVHKQAAAHLQSTEAKASGALKLTLGLGAASLASITAFAAGAVPGPVGVVLTAATMVGTVLSAHTFSVHDDAAQDDRRLLAEMQKAGEALTRPPQP